MSLATLLLVCSFAPAPPPRPDTTNGYLGVDFLPGPEELTISTLFNSSPAQQVGLLRGDVIVAFEGTKVQTVAELARLLRRKKPDTVVVLTVRRAGEELPFRVKLSKPFAAHLGVTWSPGSTHIAGLAKVSPARDAGVRLGDTILTIDGRNVGTAADLTAYLKDKKPGDVVDLVVQRVSGNVKIPVTLGKRPGL
jgi:S1-C subfamily serine protease